MGGGLTSHGEAGLVNIFFGKQRERSCFRGVLNEGFCVFWAKINFMILDLYSLSNSSIVSEGDDHNKVQYLLTFLGNWWLLFTK